MQPPTAAISCRGRWWTTSARPPSTLARPVEEKLSLSDRFGLWIGFHNCSQDDYLAMVRGYAEHYGLSVPQAALDQDALEWARGRGSRSGRVAWQFIQDLAGRLGKTLG